MTYNADVCGLNCAMNKAPIIINNMPVILKLRPPTRSYNLPVTGDNKPMTSPPGNKMRPDSKGDQCIMVCMYIGKIVKLPIKSTNINTIKVIEMVKLRYLNTLNSSNGEGSFN